MSLSFIMDQQSLSGIFKNVETVFHFQIRLLCRGLQVGREVHIEQVPGLKEIKLFLEYAI
jgi:hypothetical protein